MTMNVLFVVVATGLLLLDRVTSFVPCSRVSKTSPSRLNAETVEYALECVESEDRVLDVASFRNGMTNPQMMVDRAQAKRDAVDTTEAALNGLKIGLLYIGPLVAGGTYLETQSLTDAITNYGEEESSACTSKTPFCF